MAAQYNKSTVFSIPVTGGSPTVLTSFNGGNGEEPVAGVALIGNTLYGTTKPAVRITTVSSSASP